MTHGGLAVYVTSHGFGHLNRSVAVINQVPGEIPVTIRCDASLFQGWRERLCRPATLEAAIWDSGALNPAGDSAATDGPATLALARKVFEEGLARLDDEARLLARQGTAALLSDAPALPLLAARRAGIPGFLLANFTWSEIYEPHASELGQDAWEFVQRLKDTYQEATAVFRAEPALPMLEIARQVSVGLVVQPGRDRSAELRTRFEFAPDDKLVYFYVGRYGQADLQWDRLRALSGVQFVGFHPAPGHSVPNLRVIPAEDWNGADLAASCDAIVAKAGYGTVCEAMASGTPMIYPPRIGFAEHQVLDDALRAWGGGVPASARDFEDLNLGALLERAFALRPGSPLFDRNGALTVAHHLAAVCRGESGCTPSPQVDPEHTIRPVPESELDADRHSPRHR